MKRRQFLTAVATATAFSANSVISSAHAAPLERRNEAKYRISCQLRGWVPGKTDVEKMNQMKKWGMEAVEFYGNVIGNPKEAKKKADAAGLAVSVICGSTGGGKLCSGDEKEQQQAVDEMKRALEAAAILECNGVIFVPAFNRDQERIKRTHQEIRRSLIDIDPNTKEIKGGYLKQLGDFAASLKSHIILEPLNRKEAWFLRQIADAAVICRDSQSDGVGTMGDFYHMFYEEPCDMAAFIAGGKYVKHVHFGCGNQRVLPGQDPAHSFVAGFRGLKFIGYQGFMSFECACLGGDDQGAVEVPKTLDFLRKSWEEA